MLGIYGGIMLIFIAFAIFGVIYTSICRTNQREVVMLEIRKIERNLKSCGVEDKKFWQSELRYEEMIYSKINGWNDLRAIYTSNPRKD
jgi:hypothetical protein